jgi:hypothetical protein
VILLVVSPVLQRLPVRALEVKSVELPEQNILLPEIEGVGAHGGIIFLIL